MDLTAYLMPQKRGLVNSQMKQKEIFRIKHRVTKTWKIEKT